MKSTAPNAWQKKLTESDWNFSRCPSDELFNCWHWEIQREKIQMEAGGIMPVNPLGFVPTEQELTDAYETSVIRRSKLEFSNVSERVKTIIAFNEKWHVFLPEFPKLSWLELPGQLRRPKLLVLRGTGMILNVGWDRESMEFVQDALETNGHTLVDRTEYVHFQIPWDFRDEDILSLFSDWLRENRPKGDGSDDRPRMDEPPAKPKAKGGAGDPIRQVKKNLKALAAWRLIQHYRGNRIRACAHPGADKYLGKQFHKPTATAWSEAKTKIQKILKTDSNDFRFYRF